MRDYLILTRPECLGRHIGAHAASCVDAVLALQNTATFHVYDGNTTTRISFENNHIVRLKIDQHSHTTATHKYIYIFTDLPLPRIFGYARPHSTLANYQYQFPLT